MSEKLRNITAIARFIALLWAGSLVRIPIGPIPISLQTLFTLLLALRLKPLAALETISIYLLLGLLGLPVFAGGSGGLAVLLGPRGGYLLGMLLQVFFLTLLLQLGRRHYQDKRFNVALMLLLLLAMLLPYLPGLIWLNWRLKLDWAETLTLGFLPFIVGDLLKTFVAWLLSASLLRQRWLTDSNVEELK